MVDSLVRKDQESTCDDISLSEPLLLKARLGDCEVCGKVAAKYTCPACDVKTCSLPCCRIHKKELDCSGVRNKVKFKHIHEFTDMDLESDYRLLEEMGRSVESVVKARKPLNKNLPIKWQTLRDHLKYRGTYLHFLPHKFSKHKNNTSYLDWKTDVVYWKIEWLFPQASVQTLSVTEPRVDESCLVSDLLDKYLSPDSKGESEYNDRLKPYLEAGGAQAVKVLMKAEYTPGPVSFLMITPTNSLAENFEGKTLIEHPTLYVVLTSSIHQYNVVTPESLKAKQRLGKRRRGKGPGKHQSKGPIKFFSGDVSGSD